MKVSDSKFTGIVRKIDAGRIVVPIEIRRTLGIEDGDPMELHILGDMLCFRKRNPQHELDVATNLLEAAFENKYSLGVPPMIAEEIKKIKDMAKA